MKDPRLLSLLLLIMVSSCVAISFGLSSDALSWLFTEADGRPFPTPLQHWWQFVLPLGLGAVLISIITVLTALRTVQVSGLLSAAAIVATGCLGIGALAGTLFIVDAPPTIQVSLHRADSLAKGQEEYSLPLDPRGPFLTLSYTGGLGSRNPSWSLHSDGTLVFRRMGRIEARFTLSKEETERFATIAIAGGIMDLGPGELRERFKSAFRCSDCSSLRLEITLNRLDSASGSQQQVDVDLRLDEGAWFLARRFPESDELQAIQAISRLMRQYEKRPP